MMSASKLLNENELIDFFSKSIACDRSDKEKIINFVKKLFDSEFNSNTQDEIKK